MVLIRLFGEVGATDDSGRELDLGPAKCQAVLAVLALAPRSAIPVSRIAEAVWGESAPRTADKTLQSYVTRLRKGLGNESIVRAGAAYRLDLPGEAVDVVRFRKHLDAGDVDAALAEWTGTPLAGLEVPGLAATVSALHEQRLAALEMVLEIRVDDDAAGAVSTLTELTADHPFREGLWALLMTALYRLGRQADALAAYQQVRSHLVDELGVEPGPRLRELESRILDQSASLGGTHTPSPRQHDDLPHHGARRGNLPARRDRLIGRSADLQAIAAALSTSAVVTLVGPGGIGKTRLSLAAALAWGDGRGETWLVELAEVPGSADVPRAVAEVIGVAETPGRTLTESIVAALRPRAALVILDNCEHLLRGSAALARALAEGCPELLVLATSRERLGVPGEQLLAVDPLDAAGPAAELFAERARSVSRTVNLDSHHAQVQEICRSLDGLPLAIELAAARTATLTIPEIVERLGDRLRLLTRGPRTSSDRQRTLRATIQWSVDLLTPDRHTLFIRLSVFAGAFTLAAAHRVCADPGFDEEKIEDLLEDLVEKSMLVVEPRATERRFRLLDTLREFGAADLAQAGATEQVAQRHAEWCLEEVTRIHHQLVGSAEVEGVARLGVLWPNLRAAVDRACRIGDHLLADALVRPLAAEVTLRRQSEIGEWAERILTITPPDDVDRVVFWLTWAAHRYMHNGDRRGYEVLVGRYGHRDDPLIEYTRAYLYDDGSALSTISPSAVAELYRIGEPHLAALIELAGVASGLMATGQLVAFDAFVAPLADRYRADGPPAMLHLTLLGLGYSAMFQGRTPEADELFDEMSRVEVPERTFSVNRPIEARAAFRRGDRARAYAILRDHVDDLLATDVLDVARLTALEFVTMLSALDRWGDAGPVLPYLESTGGFGELAARVIAADGDAGTPPRSDGVPDATSSPDADAHQALQHMRDVLTDLLAG
ncbi:BTAD domain-containing putative transcriptional regulator [Pengzhenrongella phosphoraccumulans]|uniref:BTAD domain-containing putative transcriptional regulator n=1 Tax=Pengzhenrongella phosphoraccumulans TaxID=3114394 RepID=UPI00388F230D